MKKNTSLISQTTQRHRHPTIGFLTPGINLDSRYHEVWTGSCDATREQNINLIGFSVGRLTSKASFKENPHQVLLDAISPERLDGLTTFEWWPNTERFEQVCGRYQPLPIVNVMGSLEGYHCVTLDYEQLMRVKLQHLIENHGYRRIAYFRGPAKSWLAQNQYQAYLNILAEYGLTPDPSPVAACCDLFHRREEHIECGRRGVRVLLDDRQLRPGHDFEVILGFDDNVSIGALQALQERNIRVPADVAVIGSGGLEESVLTIPPLTTTSPPYYELGQKAVEVMLSLMAGTLVQQQTALPVKLHVRRSCGCLNPSISLAAADTIQKHAETFESQAATQRQPCLAAMERVTGKNWNHLNDWAERLLDAFIAEVAEQVSETAMNGEFLSTLEEILYQVDRHGGEVRQGHDVLSVLRTQFWPCLSHDIEQRRTQADTLWHQGRILVHMIDKEAQTRRRARKDHRAMVLREIGQQLINTFDVAGVMRILAEGLPRLGILGCYLSLYDNPASPKTGARLMLAYRKTDKQHMGNRLEVAPEGQPFPSAHLIPDEMLPIGRACNLIVESLHFGEELIGFVVFETSPQDERSIYNILRGEISSALQGALLLGRVNRQKYILDTFMENIPDNIYFKDRESRLTHINHAYIQSHGFSKPSEMLGKTDFDLFPEAQARRKYEQEQEIIRSGTPILFLEETDFEENCFLTTKMPLRDEHGKIIGTFGVSRDITELKLAQQSLERANAKIHALNEQLEQENLRMSAELGVARRLQEMILPKPEELQCLAGLELASYMQPADEVGGDYYDILENNGTVYIGIGDVTGHGLESGVLMLLTQAAVRMSIEHGETDRLALVATLNRMLYKNIQRMGVDKSLTFALVAYQHGRVSIVGQHEELLVVRKTGQIERIDTSALGFPVGMVDNISGWVAEKAVTLDTEDGIVLYTDGITEAENIQHEIYGLERLCAVISQNWGKTAEGVKQAVVDDVHRFIGEQIIYDDLTLVVLKRQLSTVSAKSEA